MAIVIPEPVKLSRREELEFEVAGLIEEAVTSGEDVSSVALAGHILDLIEEEAAKLGVRFK
jgi:hypothetical protein